MLRAAACGCSAILMVGAITSGAAQDRAKSGFGVLHPTLQLNVRTEVRSESAKPGDKVEFKTLEGTMLQGNLIPRSSKVIGRVVTAQGREGLRPAMLCVRLERATWDKGEVQLEGYLTTELITRMVMVDEFGRKTTIHLFRANMPDLKLLKSSSGPTTLMREENNVVLKRGMTMMGEITDVESIRAQR
jgi:hypothetical protein